MVAAGLVLVLVNLPGLALPLQTLSLGLILVAVHPRWFNPILRRLTQRKTQIDASVLQLNTYPVWPILGELVFVGLRAAGFVFTLSALAPLPTQAISPLVGAYCLGWLLGMVTPGAPGGIGVFELTVVQALNQPQFAQPLEGLSTGIVLAGVALYRLVSTLAEALSAGVGWLPLGKCGEK
jgi:uncharacterized membrane protein YbhN (UPF0104 family)